MTHRSDHDLLDCYVRDDDHEAFTLLVHRYLRMVYGAALRQTRDPGLADDVTQAAMIVLARRARELPGNIELASWLFTVAHHLSRNAIKIRVRRQSHEREAAMRKAEGYTPSHDELDELRGALDAAIARLPQVEQSGIVLHYLNNCSYVQVAAVLGISAEATRKRVRRALDRMREILGGRGIEIGAPALAAKLRSASPAGPAALTTAAIHVALLSASHVASETSPAIVLADSVRPIAKLSKVAAMLAGGLIILAGTAAVAFVAAPPAAPPAATSPAATSPATSPADDKFVARIAPDLFVEFLGCSPHPGDAGTWFRFDGQPIEMPDEHLADNRVNTDAHPDRQIALRVHAQQNVICAVAMDATSTNSTSSTQLEKGVQLQRIRFALSDARDTASMSVYFSISDWQTVATCDELAAEQQLDAGSYGPITIEPPVHDPRWGTEVIVHHKRSDVFAQLIATDDSGKKHVQELTNNDVAGPDEAISAFIFSLAPEKIKSVTLQTREFGKRIDVKNIALEANQQTTPELSVHDLKPGK